MDTEQLIRQLLSINRHKKESHCYVILDAAMDDTLYDRLKENNIDCLSLFVGEKAMECARVAPYLIQLSDHHPFQDWLLSNQWGENWGIFMITSLDRKALKKHLRNFLIVYNEDGKSLYFRYYDPRTLRTFLKAANAEELSLFFGSIDIIFAEDEKGAHMIRFENVDGQLYQEEILL